MPHTVSLLLITVLLLILPAAAVSVTIQATEIAPGEPVQVSLSTLPDGSRFSLEIEGIFPVNPGKPLHFQLTNLSLPFSLSGGEVLVTTDNTRMVSFRMKKENITTTLEARPENGTFSKRESKNISAGIYPFILLEADPLSPDQPVQARVQLQGQTYGAEDAPITFFIEGVDAGIVDVIVTVNEERCLDERITITGGDSITPEIRSPEASVPSPTPTKASVPGIIGAAALLFASLISFRYKR